MQIVPAPSTVADYCAAMNRLEIKSNEEYQRSNKVWPPAAKSFLIESIILGFPLPKLFLFQHTDLVSKKTIKEIVDGQQRSKTIHDFFQNKLVISRTSEVVAARGKKYDQLDDDLKGAFLSYQLSIDLFTAATPTEIRQAFRRLNSYTVPLNPEELRHAEYQGSFKWFIYELTRDCEEQLLVMKVFGEKQIIRMQDEKLFTDCIYSMLNGWKTTNSKALESLYKAYDKEFDAGPSIQSQISSAMDFLLDLSEIHATALMKPYIFHTLLVAIAHYIEPIPVMETVAGGAGPRAPLSREIYSTNLTALAEALDSEEPNSKFGAFLSACADKTNTADQRRIRFEWLFKALEPQLL